MTTATIMTTTIKIGMCVSDREGLSVILSRIRLRSNFVLKDDGFEDDDHDDDGGHAGAF